MAEMRIAVVTPYFTEDRSVLQRCIASVQAQSVPVDHILVADGHPQDWIESYAHINHVVLRKSAADSGDTPRSVGFVVAMRNDYDIIQFLDVDNVLFPNHFDVVLGYFRGLPEDQYPDLVVARRHMLRPDGSIINVRVERDDALKQIDTSCYVLYRTAFSLGLKWSFIPRQFAFVDDRVFYNMVVAAQLRKVEVAPVKTVGYTCMWASIYLEAGETPPPNARDLGDLYPAARAWWASLPPHRQSLIERDLGVPVFGSLPPDTA
jgi:glycosyltransferase involved in cell wall biosynthesis